MVVLIQERWILETKVGCNSALFHTEQDAEKYLDEISNITGSKMVCSILKGGYTVRRVNTITLK